MAKASEVTQGIQFSASEVWEVFLWWDAKDDCHELNGRVKRSQMLARPTQIVIKVIANQLGTDPANLILRVPGS